MRATTVNCTKCMTINSGQCAERDEDLESGMDSGNGERFAGDRHRSILKLFAIARCARLPPLSLSGKTKDCPVVGVCPTNTMFTLQFN